MEAFEARRAARDALSEVTTLLVAEFPTLPAGSVIGAVARAREDLLRAGVREGLVIAAEATARVRLAAVTSPHDGPLPRAAASCG